MCGHNKYYQVSAVRPQTGTRITKAIVAPDADAALRMFLLFITDCGYNDFSGASDSWRDLLEGFVVEVYPVEQLVFNRVVTALTRSNALIDSIMTEGK